LIDYLEQAIKVLADDPKIIPCGECFSYANRFVTAEDIPVEEWDNYYRSRNRS